MRNFRWHRWLVVAVALALVAPAAVWAQAPTGNLYGTVVDNQGEPLPGVTIELTGIGAPKIQVTNAQGQFRFLALDPGAYKLTASLEGYSTVEHPNIRISVAQNTTIQVTLSPAVEEVITVTAESPLLDERKLAAGTRISQVELEKIPTARDPWSLLNQAPGVLVDRINVGGNESGQQSVFRAPGVSDDENDFLVDGVQITDMAAIGASPTYYDFDQFEEVQLSTGGTDVTKNSSGVSVNLVTKRGTNDFRGSARFILTDEEFGGVLQQGEDNVSASDFGPGQGSITTPRVVRIEDWGVEAGGPIVQDTLWFWGSFGQNDIKQISAGGDRDDTLLENTSFKLNVQFTQSNSAVASFNDGDKLKFGRGAAPNRARETTWNQRGPSAIVKVEDTHVFSSNFFLSGMYNKLDLGFSLTSIGGGFSPTSPETLLDSDGVWKNSFISGRANRPGEEWKVDGSYFFNTGNTSHEIKFGGRFREFESNSPFGWGGRNIVHAAGENFGVAPGPVDFFFLYRSSPAPVKQEYTSFWVQDTLTTGKFTINAGLRYDLQEGENLPDQVAANAAFPDVLPGLDFPGNDGGGFDWEDISPRVGVTYALGDERKTLLRASFARFPDQLSTTNIRRVNPLGAAYAYFYFIDGNDNNMWDGPQEPAGFLFGSGFDPANPTSLVSPNRTDPGFDAPTTDELIVGVEHAFLPEFVVGLTLTYRNITDIEETRALIRDETGTVRVATRNDYVPDVTLTRPNGTVTTTLPNGQTTSVPFFRFRPGVTFTGGSLLLNGDREREYLGLTLNFTKRLANRWMLRGFFNYGDDEWDIPDSFLFFEDPTPNVGGTDIDGGVFAVQSGGSGKTNIWLQSSWQANVTGMYQVAPDRPWGFNVAANVYAREGFPIPYFVSIRGGDGIIRSSRAVSRIDDFQTDDIVTVDARLEKELRATGNVSLTLSLDIFNLTDEGYVLARERNLTPGFARPDFLVDALAPRVYRIGARLGWR